MIIFNELDELKKYVGREVGFSDWIKVDQNRINSFADITEDRQWIHIDVDKAKRESPYESTIAHGFLILSLIPIMRASVFQIKNIRAGINYGLNKVRFVTAVKAGCRIRNRVSIINWELRGQDKVLLTIGNVIEIEGSADIACVAEALGLYLA